MPGNLVRVVGRDNSAFSEEQTCSKGVQSEQRTLANTHGEKGVTKSVSKRSSPSLGILAWMHAIQICSDRLRNFRCWNNGLKVSTRFAV